jgi:hypothetical protein
MIARVDCRIVAMKWFNEYPRPEVQKLCELLELAVSAT